MQLSKLKSDSAGILLLLRSLKVFPVVLLTLLVACAPESSSPSADSEEAAGAGAESIAPAGGEPTAEVQEEESAPTKTVARTTAKPDEPTPEEVDEKSETVVTQRVSQVKEKTPEGSEPAAATKSVPVRFPEMKVPPEQAQIAKLFVDANKAFKEERYVAALQVLRKLDRMKLGEREEEALDLFLARLEEVLGNDTEEEAENTAEETE